MLYGWLVALIFYYRIATPPRSRVYANNRYTTLQFIVILNPNYRVKNLSTRSRETGIRRRSFGCCYSLSMTLLSLPNLKCMISYSSIFIVSTKKGSCMRTRSMVAMTLGLTFFRGTSGFTAVKRTRLSTPNQIQRDYDAIAMKYNSPGRR